MTARLCLKVARAQVRHRRLGMISVDRETFDDLMRRVAGQTSHRAALATLVSGALLLRAHD